MVLAEIKAACILTCNLRAVIPEQGAPNVTISSIGVSIMSQRTHFTLFALLATFLAVSTVEAAELLAKPSVEAARLSTYEHANGDTFFALSLTPRPTQVVAEGRDVLVMFDTSASQAGQFRTDALATLDSMLQTLDSGDRVKLVAVDLRSIPLTDGFVTPTGDAMLAAVDKLNQRAPLGSTDMGVVMTAAADGFADSGERQRSSIYIGDGESNANVMPADEFGDYISRLVAERVSMNSFVIGPRRNVELMAAVANQTGGVVTVDGSETSAQQFGADLARTVSATVIWPQTVQLPVSFQEVYPKTVPPLRSDRDTILIGRLEGTGNYELSVAADVAGQPMEFTWDIASERSSEDHAYLPRLVEMARQDGGVTLPTVGSAGLRETRRMMLASARHLSKMGNFALASGDTAGARVLAEAALANDPANPRAGAILAVADNSDRVPNTEPDLRLALLDDEIASGEEPGSLLAEHEAEQGAFLDSVEERRRVESAIIQAEVEKGLTDARNAMDTAPGSAKAELKLMLEQVERAPDLDADIRAQLRDRIISAVREAGRREIENDERDQLAHENLAASLERDRIVRELERRDEKIKQLMDRFNALMDEGRYELAREVPGDETRAIDPEGSVPVAAMHTASFTGAWRETMEVRELRQRGAVASLYYTEKSAIPFPDEPPIAYPPADVWIELTNRRKKYASIDLAAKGSAEEKIYAALDDPTQIEFVEVPLQDVMDYLEDLHSIQIELDVRSLSDVGITSDTPVTRNLKGISLRSAMRLMLKELDLDYVVDDEVLLITTPEEASSEDRMMTKVYPVGDLVLPIQSGAGANPFSLGGGMGGQGGFGGGMGMGGMGMGGGGMFAVDGELKLGAESPTAADAQPAVTSVRQKKTESRAKIVLEQPAGMDHRQAWDQHFTKHRESEASVREAARELMTAKKFDSLIAMLHAALSHGQAQPWMYDAMGMAMQANHAPSEEIERALMSAVDFSQTPEDIMLVALYMERIGLDKEARVAMDRRALQLYREVSAAHPARPEPYMRGLKIAQRLDDLNGIQWATVGILSQAWPKDEKAIEQSAFAGAHTTLTRLREEQQTAAADAFESALDTAMIRDCVVKVTWTGNADIDVIMEEPSGSVCSFRNPRTTAGGVMMGDTFARVDGQRNTEGYSEVYVCPQGFSGQYRMMLRRVWGQVTAGKVSVDVYTNYRDAQQTHTRKQISLGDKDALVEFSLASGRRTEPLAEQQIANVVRNQVAISKAILSQQLNSVSDSAATRDLAYSRRKAAESISLDRGNPLARRLRKVGFQPVLTTLPEGANMTATAVISADRRYVRITALPLFSMIGEVTTFNTGSGEVGGGEDEGEAGEEE